MRSLLLIILLFPLVFPLGALANDHIIYHDMDIRLDEKTLTLLIHDRIKLPSHLHGKVHTFYLNQDFIVKAQSAMQAGEAIAGKNGKFLLPYTLKDDGGEISLHYQVSIAQDQGYLDSQGIYLTADQHWYAQFNHSDEHTYLAFDMRISLPTQWHVIANARQQNESTELAHKTTVWSANQQESINLVAKTGEHYSMTTQGIKVGVILQEKNDKQAQSLLNSATTLLIMYKNIFGDYPFEHYYLVESRLKNNVDLPSFSLFTFDLDESNLAKMVVRNWLGNSLYIKSDMENWAEPLARYLSWHLVAEQQQSANAWRHQQLKEIYSLSSQENFMAEKLMTRNQLGIEKTVMFLHMLRQELGDEQFLHALQYLYQKNKFRRIGFADMEKVISHISRRNFSYFFNQWLKRPGLPKITFTDVSIKNAEGSFEVNFNIQQLQKLFFRLRLPVALTYADGSYSIERILLDKKNKEIYLNLDRQPNAILLDPFYQISRDIGDNEQVDSIYRFDRKIPLQHIAQLETALIDPPWYFSEGRMYQHWQELKKLPVKDRLNYVAMHWEQQGLQVSAFANSVSANINSDSDDKVVLAANFDDDQNLFALAMLLSFSFDLSNHDWAEQLLLFSGRNEPDLDQHVDSLVSNYSLKAVVNLHKLEQASPIYAFATGSSPQWNRIVYMISRLNHQTIQSFDKEHSMGLQRAFIKRAIPSLQVLTGKDALNLIPNRDTKVEFPQNRWSKLANMINQIGQYLSHSDLPVQGRDLAFTPYVPAEIVSNPLGLVAHARQGNGIRINVNPGSPAFQAGLRNGDIIVQLNQQEISDVDSYLQSMRDLKSGQAVAIKFLRTGKLMEAYANLVAR